MPRAAPKNERLSEPVVSVAVSLTLTELAAIARVAWVVTSLGEPREINGSDRAIRALREAAKAHPRLPK